MGASAVSGSRAMPVPKASNMKPNQTQSTSGLITSLKVAELSAKSTPAQGDVEILGRRAADGHLGGELAVAAVEVPARRVQAADLLALCEDGEVAGQHLLLAILVVAEAIEAELVAAEGVDLAAA